MSFFLFTIFLIKTLNERVYSWRVGHISHNKINKWKKWSVICEHIVKKEEPNGFMKTRADICILHTRKSPKNMVL